MLKLQEEDNATSAAGRTPRHLELEVTHDLVDVCHAGNCVRVVGVVHAVNSAVKAGGRKGKQATETSTYHLFMKANSILNTTAELRK
jgi:DNA replicative helicase MCM subunit Mcm2 (Cdc46/Mcm family)